MSRPSVLLLAALALLATGPAAAQTRPGEAAAQEAIGQIRSPYCPGLMLEVCPSPPAELLRDSIRALAAAGRPADEIVEDVLARHGEEWRAVPKRSGFGIWAWILPPAVLLLGVGVVAGRMHSMRAHAAPEPAPAALSDEDRAALAAALAELERSPEEPS
jgi:cytochrome c-type biogenesis protein CcmH